METKRPAKPPLSHLRLANPEDADAINSMLTEPICKTFRTKGISDIMYLIENCIMSLVQLDTEDQVVGFMSLKDYPMMPSVHPIAWEEYVWAKYKSVELNARNTLWIHMLCWSPMFGRDVVDNMLKSVFMHDSYVHHIAVIKACVDTPLLVPGQFRNEASFRKVTAVERGISSDILPALMIADRSEVCPRLRIRRAVEEDNDDIVPIIEKHSKRLREIYGEFYISELISRHPESERALLVCEHRELAVGVMCLNTQINYEVLEDSFDLSPFAGLKHSEAQQANMARDLEATRSYSCTYMQDKGNSEQEDRLGSKHKIKWFEDDAEPIEVSSDFHLYLKQMEYLNFLEDEEDELDFDIVNIADNQLTLPPMLTHERKLTLPKLPGIDPLDKEMPREKSRSRARLDNFRFEGEPNAFVIELFAMHSDYDERYGFDILEAAFEIFPDRDYCVICLPSNHSSFPLLEHFTLVTPHGNHMRFINETLYVAHRNSIRGDLRVRLAERSDMDDVYILLEHTQRTEFFVEVFERSLDSASLCPYFLLSENKPVGLAVLGPLEDSTAVRNQFVLEPEPRRPGTDGIILLGVMSPALEPHTRWFLRELIRQSQFTTLFWVCRQFAVGESNPIRNLMSLTSHLSPKRCRVGMVNITGNKETEKFYKEHPGFALWVLERGLTSLPKVHVNNSIVVVGASRTGLAFIESLIIGPASDYLTFTNITLVSEHGLPTVHDCFKAAEMCIPKEGRYSDKYLKCIPFYFYIDVISSAMKNIDRRKKCIHLKDGTVKYYDELVLTCGKQFQHPDYLCDTMPKVNENEANKICDRMLLDNPRYLPDTVPDPPQRPANLFLINSLYDANYCLKKLLAMMAEANAISSHMLDPNYPIAVYGDCVEAYACMAGLIELGISPKNIIFIEPFPAEDESKLRVNCFNNEAVDEKVQAALESKGIRAYRQCRLDSLMLHAQKIVAVHLMSAFHHLTLPCFAFFYYGLKAIDLNAFRAINESGLVYDGGLVIGAQFDTNDPSVYGAGPCTQYSRRLYASKWLHSHFYSEEVGVALARHFLHKFDPFVVCNKNATNHELFPKYSNSLIFGDDSLHQYRKEDSEVGSGDGKSLVTQKEPKTKPADYRWEPVIRFQCPIVIAAHLPGPLFYMNMRRPGRDLPFEVQMSLPKQGHTLLTEKKNNYFRLQLNSNHCVESLTCLSTKNFSSEVFARLYGMHEAFFNKLLIRFTKKKVDDLYDYFVQPWMAVLYQETFDDLMFKLNHQKIHALYEALTKYFRKHARAMVCEGLGVCCTLERCCCNTGAKSTSVSTDCGQRYLMHAYAKQAWEKVGGDNIVLCYLASYLDRHTVINPHYARPISENVPKIDISAAAIFEMLDADSREPLLSSSEVENC